jgi:hypothetical protein
MSLASTPLIALATDVLNCSWTVLFLKLATEMPFREMLTGITVLTAEAGARSPPAPKLELDIDKDDEEEEK